MAEVMAKSKSYKAERQHQNDLDADLRDELDGDINDLRALLQPRKSASDVKYPARMTPSMANSYES
jgi:nucleolar protein 14